ncbi:MAG: NADH-quinone oxidoreductase subunit C [Planctomycetaceae bacterium]
MTDRFPMAVTGSHVYCGDQTVILRKAFLREVAEFVQADQALQMNFLMDVTAVDYLTFDKGPAPAFFASSGVDVRPSPQIPTKVAWPGPPSESRFAVVYHFYSLKHKHRLRLVVPVEESDPELDSLTSLWAGANWLEREIWDMYGIRFSGHPDLKRILMYEEFEGHPLRKDYPVNKRQPLIEQVDPDPGTTKPLL